MDFIDNSGRAGKNGERLRMRLGHFMPRRGCQFSHLQVGARVAVLFSFNIGDPPVAQSGRCFAAMRLPPSRKISSTAKGVGPDPGLHCACRGLDEQTITQWKAEP